MNNKLRNPFKMRASEKVESDASFLRLFSPIALDTLAEKHTNGKLWGNVLFIHSSPGAGKTSLIRVFEPSSLVTLLANKSASDYKELFSCLKRIETVTNDSIEVLGVTLICTRNYEILEELNISEAQKKRIFFSLLNARIVISTLRAISNLSQQTFPDCLSRIYFDYNNSENYFKSITTPCTGEELYNWASNLERQIYRAVDSFLPIDDLSIEGHDELFAFSILTPDCLTIDGKKISNKILFMLDDAHKLSRAQRNVFRRYVIERRGNFNIWISERLEALEPDEQLRSFNERDYEEINLEKFWSDSYGKFEKILKSISDKRAALSTEDVNSFQEFLTSNLNEERYKDNLQKQIETSWQTIQKLTAISNKFDEWVKVAHDFQGSVFEKAQFLKEMEILIQRNLGKSQMSFEFPLTKLELDDKMSSEITSAARLFLSQEAKIPYYFGFGALSRLSSNNIEQFLAFAGELFEEMISNKISGKEIIVGDDSQEKIIKEIAERKWREISRTIPYSTQIIRFLTALGEFAQKDTFKPNAPYAPGVNGFAIKNKVELKLISEGFWLDSQIYEPLVNVISTCVAFNLLEVKTINQGKKGQVWEVYYLNRWLCVKFGLPMSYGGWRHKTPDELLKWTKK